MASRRKGRILAFQALYSWEATGSPGEWKDLLNFSWAGTGEILRNEEPQIANQDFSRLLVTGTIENIASVDAMICSHLENWDFSRLNRVDLAILRMSTYTLMFQNDVPPSIIIDEAIGISKEFGTDDSFKFINGVLDSIRRTLQDPKTIQDQAEMPSPSP
ncbi:MAG: transcription antitermination factor NusB [Treponema sp.]|jgi:N utilization substance protein B|nr:transcription antitermination factor NusB [Treponema sp.]